MNNIERVSSRAHVPDLRGGRGPVIGLTLWLRLVEEPELIERFGEGYVTYRRKVPAFWPRVQDAGKFWGFLITGR